MVVSSSNAMSIRGLRGWGAVVAVTVEGSTDRPPGVGELCPTGETGFVWLNTPALMKGYLDRDDLTAQCVRAGWFLTAGNDKTGSEPQAIASDPSR